MVQQISRKVFGAELSHVSAWHLFHYFATRYEQDTFKLWPQGSGILTERLSKDINNQIRTQSIVWKIEQLQNGKMRVTFLDLQEKQSSIIDCEHVIFAAPQSVAKATIVGFEPPYDWNYSIWILAKIRLATKNLWGPLAFENTIFNAKLATFSLESEDDESSIW